MIYKVICFSYIKEYSNWIFNGLLHTFKKMCTAVSDDLLSSKSLLGLSYYMISCHKKLTFHTFNFLGFWRNQIKGVLVYYVPWWK
jgi:hypothetical protein